MNIQILDKRISNIENKIAQLALAIQELEKKMDERKKGE